MKIIFVRHGHPDYQNDCLTETGHMQAKAAAKRLRNTHIDKFFSSSCGRAYETACHIASLHNQEVEKLDFMREISWGKSGTEDFVQPWWLSDGWVKMGKDIMCPDWQNDADYADHTVLDSYRKVANSFDSWLSELGLSREGSYYRITRENPETLLLASHGGSSSVALSHIFNLPFSFVCHAICPGFTAITEISFEGTVGELTAPRFTLVNDINHIKTAVDKICYDN